MTQKRFLPLFLTQFCGAFNDNFLKNALVILITFQSVTVLGLPHTQIVALAGGIFILPFFLFSALAGQVADKFEKGSVIRCIKAIEIGIMFIAIFGFYSHMYMLLLVSLFLMGLHSTFFGPLKYSILPQHLRSEELLHGTALIEAGTFVAILLGTIAGGVLIAAHSGISLVCAGLMLIALFGYLTSLRIPWAAAVDANLKLQWLPFRPTWDLFQFARKKREVIGSIWAISWFWFIGAAMLSIFPSLCKDVLLGNEHLVTLFLALFSVGIAAGSMLASRLSRPNAISRNLILIGGSGMSVLCGALYFLCANVTDHPVTVSEFVALPQGFLIVTDLFLFSVSAGLFIVPLYTLMQKASDLVHRSRIIAANNVLNAFLMVIAAVFLMLALQFELSLLQILLALAGMNALAVVRFTFASCNWKFN